MKHIFPRIAFEQKLLGNLAKIKKIGGNQLLRGQKEVDKGSIESPQWVTRQRVDSRVMRVGGDTFGDPIFQKGLQN